jgi:multicomponent K+:H+ antiporter subunit E
MRRAAKYLVLPAFLFLAWLVINDSASPGQIVLGAVLAAVLTWAARALRPLHARPRRLWLVPALAAKVLWDLLRSNLAVARIICLPERLRPRSGFVQIPIRLENPHGLAALACILTYTPGSVWVDLNPDKRLLTLHVLDVGDEASWVRLVTERYEKPLLEIFE